MTRELNQGWVRSGTVVRQQVIAIALAGATVAGASTVMAQQPDASRSPSAAEVEQQMQRRRDAISSFENTLERAVTTGARNLTDRLTKATGVAGTFDALLLSLPAASGFQVPDYGLFFTVRVPGMNGTMVWAMAETLRVRQTPGGNTLVGLPPESPPPPPISPFDAELMTDPNVASAAYRDAIKEALLDAMLEDSSRLQLSENEWLTVAARREGRANPLDPNDRVKTVTFRVRGSVLESLRLKKIDAGAARKQVGVVED